jgi:hypothetical protein
LKNAGFREEGKRGNPILSSLEPAFLSGLYFNKNKVLTEKSETKIEKMSELCRTLN